ncbi:MAG TPA: NAD(+) diphosphatase [Rhizomicrobium sp.]|jgi:NAD+ diphosphatase
MMPFAGSRLDRASEHRTDAEWVKARLLDPQSLILPIWNLQPLVTGSDDELRAAFLPSTDYEILAGPHAVCVFLGLDEGRAIFALDISSADQVPPGLGEFRDLRAAAPLLKQNDIAILGQAKALIDWHQRHGFCPRCGARTQLVDAGYRRLCAQCGADHFPRTDPVVIMLAFDGDQCLVGRGRNFSHQTYSTLAGFIEPGETIEEAVRREILEESGIRIGRVTYQMTQPWPFPSSLMIGCFAEALTREIVIDTNELEDARWLHRDTARLLLAGEIIDGMRIPPPIAIAHHLIKAWVNEKTAL